MAAELSYRPYSISKYRELLNIQYFTIVFGAQFYETILKYSLTILWEIGIIDVNFNLRSNTSVISFHHFTHK